MQQEETQRPAVWARSPEKRENPTSYCPVCSERLKVRSCKLVCPVCGYYMSCSDYY